VVITAKKRRVVAADFSLRPDGVDIKFSAYCGVFDQLIKQTLLEATECVILAYAGIQEFSSWVPAFAGTTNKEEKKSQCRSERGEILC
jgi:hypothetical protein